MVKINTYIIDRASNKRYTDFSELFNEKNLPHKKVYYKGGNGVYEGTFNNLFFDFYHEEINKIRESVIFTGSSSSSILSFIYNMKKPINILNILEKVNLSNNASVKESLYILFNYFLTNVSIDDLYIQDLFIPILSMNKIFKKEIDLIFYTNFQTIEDVVNCLIASTFIPKVSNDKFYFIYDNKVVLDPDLLDFFNFRTDIVNYNLDEVKLFKYCFNSNLDPYTKSYWILKLTLELFRSNPTFDTNIIIHVNKCYDIIKNLDLQF